MKKILIRIAENEVVERVKELAANMAAKMEAKGVSGMWARLAVMDEEDGLIEKWCGKAGRDMKMTLNRWVDRYEEKVEMHEIWDSVEVVTAAGAGMPARDAAGTGADMPAADAAGTGAAAGEEDRKVYEWELRMTDNYPEDMREELEETIRGYMVMAVMWEWVKMVESDGGEGEAQAASTMVAGVKADRDEEMSKVTMAMNARKKVQIIN